MHEHGTAIASINTAVEILFSTHLCHVPTKLLLCRVVAIRFGVIRLVICKNTISYGAWGMLPLKIFLNLGAMRLHLRPILCQYDACRRPEDRVSHECHSAHCVVHHWCRLSDPVRLSAESHTLLSQVKLARLIILL